jgi:hypothetical protein
MPLDPTAVLAASGATKGTDAGTVAAAGISAGSPEEAVVHSTATAAYGQATTTADQLHQLPDSLQYRYWSGLTPQQQGLLRSVKYDAPANPNAPSGILGDIGHGFEDVAGGIGRGAEAVGGFLGHGAAVTLHQLGEPLSGMQHLIRAGQVVAEQGVLQHESIDQAYQHASQGGFDPQGFADSWTDAFHPSAWSRAWAKTANGETTFDPIVYRYLPTDLHRAVRAVARLQPWEAEQYRGP